MPKYKHAQTSFLSGQVSPKVMARTDLKEYQQGCETLQNMVPLPAGGAARRVGTRFICDARQNNAARPAIQRLIPFVYSRADAYVLSLSSGAPFQGAYILRNDGTLCTLTDTSGITTTLTYQEMMEVQYAQSGDVMYLVHPNHKPCKLTRTGATTFTLAAWDALATGLAARWLSLRYPFRDANVTTMTMTPSAVSGNINITASSAFWDTEHIGALIKITHAGVTGLAQITGWTSTTVVTATVKVNFGATTASDDWEESAWSTYRGWPRSVCFHEGRLVMGGNEAQPDTIWASRVGNFDHFMASKFDQDASADTTLLKYFGATVASDPVARTIASTEVNTIQWLASQRSLYVGTLGAEYSIGSANDPAFDATALPNLRSDSAVGSFYTMAKRMGSGLAYVSRSGVSIRDVKYDYTKDKNISRDLSLLGSDTLRRLRQDRSDRGEVWELAWSGDSRILWARVAIPGTYGYKAQLVGFTFDEEGGAAGWHTHILGGPITAVPADYPWVTGFCVIPSTEGKDELWMCVIRTIDGTAHYGIEAMETDISLDDSTDRGVFYMDAYKTVTGPGTVFSGFDHMEGESVQVVNAEGFYLGEYEVVSGDITLEDEQTEITAGFEITPKLKTLPIEGGAAIGSSQGSISRIDKVTARLYRTGTLKIGSSFDDADLTEIEFRTADVPMDEMPPLYTGDQEVDFLGDYGTRAQVCITTDKPLPMTVCGLFIRMVVNDG
jgi:hypothetical protein